MADQALSCIESLLESIPRWIAEIEDILKSSQATQEKLLAEQQPAEEQTAESRPPSIRRKLSKSSSIRSKRSSRNDAGQQPVFAEQPSKPDLLRPQLPHMTDSDALRLSQRKRKTFSVCSGDPSAPHKYRSRAMVVVYYDGDTQKRFDGIVRSIASTRNAVRKCRMGGNGISFGRAESSTSDVVAEAANDEDEGGQEETLDLAKFKFRTTRSPRSTVQARNDAGSTEALGSVDDLLEKTSDLCERAAHQVLRDGDCTLELGKAKEHLGQARRLGEDQLPDLKRRAEEDAKRGRSADKQKSPERVRDSRSLKSGISLAASPVPSLVPSIPADGGLEVDLDADDSDGGGDFVPDAFRYGKWKMQTKSAEVIAH